MLRDHGVYIETGRLKKEVIDALIVAVKHELPWPDQAQRPSAKSFVKRVAESSTAVVPRKLFNFQSERRVEEEQNEPANTTNSFNFHLSHHYLNRKVVVQCYQEYKSHHLLSHTLQEIRLKLTH